MDEIIYIQPLSFLKAVDGDSNNILSTNLNREDMGVWDYKLSALGTGIH